MLDKDAETRFIRALLESDIETCKEIVDNYTQEDIQAFVNKTIGSSYFRTCIHIAAHKLVSLEVWTFLLPFAENSNLFNIVQFLLPYRDEIFKESGFKSIPSGLSVQELIRFVRRSREKWASIYERHAIKRTQLDKVKYWLEFTKKFEENQFFDQRSYILCGLCRCREGNGEEFASMQEILTLAQSCIKNYKLDINGTRGENPLNYAIESRNKCIFDLLLKNGANVNVRDSRGLTPLNCIKFFTYTTDRLEICSQLIEHGADICVPKQKNGETGLHSILTALQANELNIFFAANLNFVDLTSEKIATLPLPPLHGLIVHTKNQREKSVQKSFIEKVKVLRSFGFDIFRRDIHNRTILHYACWLRMNLLVKFLESVKISPFDQDAFGRDCMYYAISCPSDDTLKVKDPEENVSTLKCLETHLFRPLSTLKNHFDKTEHLSTLAKLKGVTFVENLLNNDCLGPVRHTSLNKKIIDDIQTLVNKLGQRLAKKDGALGAKIELAGSMSENSKVNPPDEFDFQFHLITLSQHVECYATDIFELSNEVLFRKTNTEKNQVFFHVLDELGSLNLNITRLFFASSYSVLQERSFWNGLPFCWHFVHDYTDKNSLINPLLLKYVCPNSNDLEISVDLVPIIVQNKIPNGAETTIPKPIIDFVEEMGLKWYVVCRDEEHGRFSFFVIERAILKRLNQAVQEAYKLTKCMKQFVSNYQSKILTSYILKNALFQELDPDGSYNLLKNQIAQPFESSYFHSFILGEMKLTLSKNLENKTKNIQSWAFRILDRLEKSFSSKDGFTGIPVYCSPRVSLPAAVIDTDIDGTNPYLDGICKLKCMLKD